MVKSTRLGHVCLSIFAPLLVLAVDGRDNPTELGLYEPLSGSAHAQTPLDPGQLTPDGWRVVSGNSQLVWDLGRPYDEGTIEFEAKGDWLPEDKRVIFALWNISEGSETDASGKTIKKAALFQLRLMDEGMMLRLTASGQARTIEKHTGLLTWPDCDRWVHIKATFTTRNGGVCRLWRDGVEIRNGSLRGNVSPGFRYVFLGATTTRGAILRSQASCFAI